MSALANVQAALAKEGTDISTLAGLVTTLTGLVQQILAAVAAGGLSAADAAALISTINSQDASVGTGSTAVQSMITAIQGALPPAPPAPSPTPAPAP